MDFPLDILDLAFSLHPLSMKRYKDANAMISLLISKFVDDLLERSYHVAKEEGSSNISPDHVRQILPKVMLDYF
jgi:hypothetical protein